jgi:2'-5' RNA ligase
MRSAITVAFPGAAVVDGWRERTCVSKPSHGVPPHVTLLFPFAPAPVAEALLPEIADIVSRFQSFAVSFARMQRFPGTLWLAPEPAEPFARLSRALVERFPAWPPYEGAFPEPVPHLTVAQGDAALLDDAEVELAPLLPLAARVREVALVEEIEPDRWRQRATFPLAEEQ